MTDPERYLHEHHDRFLSELTEFLTIPSVSAVPENAPDVRRCAEWLAAHINGIGISAQVHETAGHPIVYGEWLEAGDDAPTVLFYGHYDVQPVDPLNLWTNPPFEPVIRNGKIYARGATDDKGQVFLQLKCLEAHLKTHGKLPVNVKLLIEGEEEVGSDNLEHYIRANTEALRADCVLVSDTPIFALGIPSLVYGLRGLCYMEVTVTGPNRDLHSGAFGGAVENPVNALCAMIARLKDGYGRITIPGFYDNVAPLSPDEREEFSRLPFDQDEYNKGLNIPAEFGEFGYSTNERVWARPTLDVNGIYGGYTGEGAKTVLPSKATAKISMRLVPNQENADIAQKFEAYLRTIAPPTVTVSVTALHGANPVITPRQSRGMNAATRALEYAYGAKPFHVREGGSIPVCLLFDTILHAPTVLMGFGLSDENAHSPDEHFSLDNFAKGMTASATFYDEFAKPE